MRLACYVSEIVVSYPSQRKSFQHFISWLDRCEGVITVERDENGGKGRNRRQSIYIDSVEPISAISTCRVDWQFLDFVALDTASNCTTQNGMSTPFSSLCSDHHIRMGRKEIFFLTIAALKAPKNSLASRSCCSVNPPIPSDLPSCT